MILRTVTHVVAQASDTLPDSTVTDLELFADELQEPDLPTPESDPVRFTWTSSIRHALEKRAGFTATDSTRFPGPPVSIRSRLRAHLGRHASVIFVADHDAGEEIAWIGKVFDFVSASLTLTDLGPIRRLVVGAMHPRIGLGLSIWGGQRMTRLISTPGSFLHPSASVRASGSTSEIDILHGVGLEMGLSSRLLIVGFAARSTQDAQLDETGSARTLPTSGLHRTETEALADDQLAGRMIGGVVELLFWQLGVGVFYGSVSSDKPIAPGDRSYQRFRHSGDRWHGGGVYASVRLWGLLDAAAETSVGPNGVPATLVVARVRTRSGLSVFGSYRDYPPEFDGAFGAPPASSSATRGNEAGGTIGIEVKLPPVRMALSRDVHRRPWLQADSYRPSTSASWSFLAEGEWPWARTMLRFDSRSFNRLKASEVPAAAPFSVRERLRVRAVLAGSDMMESVFDLAVVRYRRDRLESGHALGQRVIWKPLQSVGLTAGVVFFGSDSGNSGVYLHEPDLPDFFSIPLLSEAGQRVHIMVDFGFTKSVRLFLKLAVTSYESERIIGAGVDRIATSHVRTIAFAMRIRD